MESEDAVRTLKEVGRVRTRTRTTLTSFWFPLVLFGSLWLLSAGVIALISGPAVGVYWAVAGPLGGLITSLYYRRRERLAGLEGPALPYLLTTAGIIVGCFAVGGIAGAQGADLTAMVGPSFVVGTGLLVFAWLDRSAALAAFGIGMIVAATALIAADADPEGAGIALSASFGGAAVVAGLVYRGRERDRQ